MSRLDSFIRRLTAQRDCLDVAARLVQDVPGPVLEFGLGNGRTYSHLREIFTDREIFVFDRQVASHPDSTPDDAHMILGDFTETLPMALDRIGDPAAFIHCDMGSGRAEVDSALAAAVGPLLALLAARGGVIASDQEMWVPGWTALPLPEGVASGRYFLWRVGGT